MPDDPRVPYSALQPQPTAQTVDEQTIPCHCCKSNGLAFLKGLWVCEDCTFAWCPTCKRCRACCQCENLRWHELSGQYPGAEIRQPGS